uniref:Caffeic acid 3-O-methyltransferase n=1 Tax=Rauvolfia serpentina TaxID=4060 RepID=A0A1I9RGJ7_RAUSE|nr:caffeic acid OMT-like protein [Rauvolfia serpentina]
MNSPVQDQISNTPSEEEDFFKVMQLSSGLILPMILKAAIELELFELIAKAGPGAKLSAVEIASQLSTKNPNAAVTLDRMMKFLASFSFLNCSLVTDAEGHPRRLYSFAPTCKNFLPDEDGVSFAPVLMLPVDKVHFESWYHLKDAVLEGGIPFIKANGDDAFAHPVKDTRFYEVFNKALHNHACIVTKRLLKVYRGFEGVKQLVDVGGGHGGTLGCIVSKYPHIHAINFDVPPVIEGAPPRPGVEFVGGDMFERVPKGEVLLMKWVLHDWSDEHCLKILKNCYEALPESGKLIVIELVLPETPNSDPLSKIGYQFDMNMMSVNLGGKERTEKEFEDLAKQSGFASIKLICRAGCDWVIEFYKD